MMMKWTYSENK